MIYALLSLAVPLSIGGVCVIAMDDETKLLDTIKNEIPRFILNLL